DAEHQGKSPGLGGAELSTRLPALLQIQVQRLVSGYRDANWFTVSTLEPADARLRRQLRMPAGRRAVRALDHVPEVAIARAIVQVLAAVVAMADRAPVGGLRGHDHLDGQVDLGGRRRE